MPMIKTLVDENSYAELVAMRKRAGLPSVSALFLKKTVGLTDEKEASEIVRRALEKAKSVKWKSTGSEFRLRDLFIQEQWKMFSVGARIRAGKMFNEKVSGAVDGIRATRKSRQNHQFYASS